MTGPVGRDRLAVLDQQGMRHVIVQTEAVRLQIGRVWHGGEQMHRHVVRAMGGDRQVERLGKMRGLSDEEAHKNLAGHSADPVRSAALQFARAAGVMPQIAPLTY